MCSTHTHTCKFTLLYLCTAVKSYLIVCLFSPILRHSLSSSYVWRLHQTSSASSSSPSNGCFLLPAPMYGFSMSGTQVSPSFQWILFFFMSASHTSTFTSKTPQEILSCQVCSVLDPKVSFCFFLSLTFTQREESVYPLYRCGSSLCTSKLPYGLKT